MTSTAYSSFQKFLHWAIFLLIVGLWGLAHLRGYLPKDDPGRGTIIGIHISFGLLLLFLVGLRVVWRLVHGAPDLPAGTPLFEALLAKVTHLAFYALMIVIPVLGVYLVWLHGHGASFFGLFTIPSPVQASKTLHDRISGVHELLANGILILFVIHAAAAIWHHYVKKDDVLTRMLPKRAS